MKNLLSNRDLEVNVTAKNPSTEDALDKLDFTIRILMSQIRQVKASAFLKAKVWRMLSKQDQVKLDMVLNRVILPPELIGQDLIDDEECAHGGSFSMDEQMVVAERAVVPWKPLKEVREESEAPKKPKLCSLRPLPGIFKEILGKTTSSSSLDQCVREEKPVKEAKPTSMSHQPELLQRAMNYEPAVTLKTGRKSKEHSKEKTHEKVNKKVKKSSAMKKAKSSQKKSNSKAPQKKADSDHAKQKESEHKSSSYQPGKMKEFQEEYMDHLMEQAKNKGKKLSKTEARQEWMGSLKRAELLAGLPLAELKRRRFVDKSCQENPFLAQVLEANPDID